MFDELSNEFIRMSEANIKEVDEVENIILDSCPLLFL
jgi:hypothetical protein